MKHLLIIYFILMNACVVCARTEFKLEQGWKFTRIDDAESFLPNFNDSDWQSIVVPHDWAIYGPFDINNDPQFVAITQDGQSLPTLKAGRTGGLPFVGVGWYRIHFDAPNLDNKKVTTLLFDGAMSNTQVYLNGEKVGMWPYGYGSFGFDVTKNIKSKDNVLAIRLENNAESSRWYPGAGIYRNVHVIIKDDIYIPEWGTQLTTPIVRNDYARVKLATKIKFYNNASSDLILKTVIKNSKGENIAEVQTKLKKFDKDVFIQEFDIKNPLLWSPRNPNLYIAESQLYASGKIKDTQTITFGVRELKIIPEKGMFINGDPIKFKGVCLHHDLGPLGSAINVSALRRQLKLLKGMGVNAIRTSHNIPSPEQIELCDEMGIMVMVETFDEWIKPKMKNGYNLHFNEWAEKDLVNTVRRYRNNPSVIMWCIGNEVPDQDNYEGAKIARRLKDICHREDPTRYVTAGIDQVENAINTNFTAAVDVVGLNYRTHLYEKVYNVIPNQILMGSETASTFSSRGTYHFPVVRTENMTYANNQSSGYDLDCGSWSNLPEDDFVLHDDYAWCIGEFVWTGFDYLGEPTPYYEQWPNHSSMFGIFDLAGLPKDRYYLYRSHWLPEEETLHILPHWTWSDRVGEVTPVFVYTNYPSAELFVNGKSQGRVYKDTTMTHKLTSNEASIQNLDRQRRYRLMWMDVRYEPGTIRVVAYDKDGKKALTKDVHTAGEQYKLILSADRNILDADGKDLSFITVKMVDKDGNLCPHADTQVFFKTSGAGKFRAAANGDPTCLDIFHKPQMKLFNGQLVAIVQSFNKSGEIIFEVSAEGVKSEKIKIHVQ